MPAHPFNIYVSRPRRHWLSLGEELTTHDWFLDELSDAA